MVSYIAAVRAFFLSGRFIRTVRRGPSSLMMTRSGILSVRQCFAGGVDGVAAIGDRRCEAAGGGRHVCSEEPRDADALCCRTAVAAGAALGRQRVLCQHAAAGGDAEQTEVRGRAGKRLVRRLVEVREQPARRTAEARHGFAKPLGGGTERRI